MGNSPKLKNGIAAAAVAAALTTGAGAQAADTNAKVADALRADAADTPTLVTKAPQAAVDLSAQHLNGKTIPGAAVLVQSETGKTAAKILYAGNGNNQYGGVVVGTTLGDKAYGTLSVGAGHEATGFSHLNNADTVFLNGQKVQAGANWVTDSGVRMGGYVAHTTVGGKDLGVRNARTTQTEVSQTSHQEVTALPDTVISTQITPRVETIKNNGSTTTENWNDTVTTTGHSQEVKTITDTTTTNRHTDTRTERGLSGSYTTTAGLTAEVPLNQNWALTGGVAHTRMKYSDGTSNNYNTASAGAKYYADNWQAYAKWSQNFAGKSDSTVTAGVEGVLSPRIAGYAEVSHGSKTGNSGIVGVRIPLGGKYAMNSKPYAQPTTPAAYMQQEIRQTGVADIAPHHMADSVKPYEHKTVTQTSESDTKTAVTTEVKQLPNTQKKESTLVSSETKVDYQPTSWNVVGDRGGKPVLEAHYETDIPLTLPTLQFIFGDNVVAYRLIEQALFTDPAYQGGIRKSGTGADIKNGVLDFGPIAIDGAFRDGE